MVICSRRVGLPEMPPNHSLKLTRLSLRLYLGSWVESGAGQRYVSGRLAARRSPLRRAGPLNGPRVPLSQFLAAGFAKGNRYRN